MRGSLGTGEGEFSVGHMWAGLTKGVIFHKGGLSEEVLLYFGSHAIQSAVLPQNKFYSAPSLLQLCSGRGPALKSGYSTWGTTSHRLL